MTPAPTSTELALRPTRRDRVPVAGSIPVERVTRGLPRAGSRAVAPQPSEDAGETGLGRVDVGEKVVARIASRAVLDVPDAGGAATGALGRLTGGHLGSTETSLASLPKTTATVDGTSAFVVTTVSVRWPAPISQTAQQVRDAVRSQVKHMAGLDVPEVEVRVEALVTRPASRPKVR